MSNIEFTWDPWKAALSQKKHGVSFDEAVSVFYDENALCIDDPDHSSTEDRFVILGISAELRILVVSHCYREDESSVRIISARKANRIERKFYEDAL